MTSETDDSNNAAEITPEQLGSAEMNHWTFTTPDGKTQSLAEIQAANEAAQAAMAQAIREDAEARTDNFNRWDHMEDEDLPGFTPKSEDDIEDLTDVRPNDVPAALRATSPQGRDLNR